MSSITFDSDEDIYVLSSADRVNASNTSSPSTLNDSASYSSNSYTPEQLNRFLLRKNDELDRYLLLQLYKNKEAIEALDFWEQQQQQFPFYPDTQDVSSLYLPRPLTWNMNFLPLVSS